MNEMEATMRTLLAVLGLLAGLPISMAEAEAQTVYVPHGGRVIAVPAPVVPAPPPPVSAMAPPADGGVVRIDGLPAGAVLAVNGRALGGAEVSGGWIVLPPGPHSIDVALPGGGAVRFTVVTPVESSGYQVVPKP